MTYEEGIKYFKNHIQSYCVTGVCKEAEELAIEALKKQAPMKPKLIAGKYALLYRCTTCNCWLEKNEKYCKCGQRLDWSERNDLH